MKKIKLVRPLNNEGIAEAVKAVNGFLINGGCDQKDIVRVTLSVEESLLTVKDSLPENESFTVSCTKFLKTNTVTVTVSGKNVVDRFNNDDSFELPLNSMLLSGHICPEYSYESGLNKIKLEVKEKKRLSLTQTSLIAIAIGAVLGFLALFLPETVCSDISSRIVSPIFSTFIGVVSAVAGIMVFLTVTQSIYLIGDRNAFQKIGRKFFRNTLGKMLLLSVICTLACKPLFHSGTGSGVQMDLFQIFDMILQIVPTDIVSPFFNGSILQILFLAVILGVTLLLLGSRVTVVKQFIDQCGDVINHIMDYILQLMPYSIAMSIFTLITGGKLSSLGSVVKLLIIFVVFTFLTILWNVLYTCLLRKKSVLSFLRDTLPILITSFTTASSAATLPISMDICEQKLGIDKKLITFGIPMSTAVFKLGSIIYRVVLAFGLAEIFGVSITTLWMITCILLSYCLSIAVPAIPGGGMSVLTLLLSQLGIPSEALALALACDIIMDTFSTACNCYCDVAELTNIAKELDMLKK